MFQSVDFDYGNSGIGSIVGHYTYTVVDSDFVEDVVFDLATSDSFIITRVMAIIEAYEKRNLPVAPNVAIAIVWLSKCGGGNIGSIIEANKQRNPKFAKYKDDITKYLILI